MGVRGREETNLIEYGFIKAVPKSGGLRGASLFV
jgi:hypothetical protein